MSDLDTRTVVSLWVTVEASCRLRYKMIRISCTNLCMYTLTYCSKSNEFQGYWLYLFSTAMKQIATKLIVWTNTSSALSFHRSNQCGIPGCFSFWTWRLVSLGGSSFQWQDWGLHFLAGCQQDPSQFLKTTHVALPCDSLSDSCSMGTHFFKPGRRLSYSSLLRQNCP